MEVENTNYVTKERRKPKHTNERTHTHYNDNHKNYTMGIEHNVSVLANLFIKCVEVTQ